jgi:hypothetical protein
MKKLFAALLTLGLGVSLIAAMAGGSSAQQGVGCPQSEGCKPP